MPFALSQLKKAITSQFDYNWEKGFYQVASGEQDDTECLMCKWD